MVRTPCCDKNGLKKGAWTSEEDKKLVDYITRYGHWNWRELPKFAGLSRCGKSCRLRWMNYLRPNIKIGNFNREEEEIIINMHEELGNKWAAIAAKLPGRTDNEIKNYWHTNLKKRCKQNLNSPDSNPETSSEKVYECNSEQEFEFNSLPPTVLSAQTLENSPPLSPVPSLTDSSTSRIVYDTAPSDKFAAISGDFWTEPYVAGNSYIQENIQQTWADPEFIFSLDPLLLEEYNYCTYGSSEDNYMEWFN